MERAPAAERNPTRCPYCHDGVRVDDDEATRCPTCSAPHHGACWREHMGCATCRTPDGDGRETFSIISRRRSQDGDAGPVPEGTAVAAIGRLEAIEEGGTLVLGRSFPRQLGPAIFLAIWLCGWLAGEVAAIGGLVALAVAAPWPVMLIGGAFLLLWLALWTAGGLAAGTTFLAMLGAEERLEVGRDDVVLRRMGVRRIPLWRAVRARCDAIRDVRVEVDSAVLEHEGGKLTWKLGPDQAAWVVTRVRKRLGLASAEPAP